MTVETPSQKPRMRLGLRIILIASLTMNLVVVGLTVGAVVGHARDGDSHGRIDRSLPPHVRAFDRAHRREIAKDIRKAYRSQGIGAKVERRQIAEMADLVGAVPYDPEALSAFRAQSVRTLAQRVEVANDIWLGFVKDMDEADRLAYAERLRKALDRRKPPSKPERTGE